jgi:hypothetical protein
MSPESTGIERDRWICLKIREHAPGYAMAIFNGVTTPELRATRIATAIRELDLQQIRITPHGRKTETYQQFLKRCYGIAV